MKQLLAEVHETSDLKKQLAPIVCESETENYSNILIHVYSGVTDQRLILQVCRGIRELFPDAILAGSLSAGEIKDGKLMDQGFLISAMFFECTNISLERMEHVKGHEAEVGKNICGRLNEICDLKAAELLLPGTELNTRVMFEEISRCRSEIQIFGGYAGGHGMECPDHYVFDENGIYGDQVFVITYAGKDFHISTSKCAGWQTLGRPFKVTKADENRLIELNHRPAVEVYEKYLQIDRNDNFAENTFEFPLMAVVNGEELLRHTMLVEEDGTLLLAGYVTEGMEIYLCYGNPSDIVLKVDDRLKEVAEFGPEAILLYSCTVRKSFWEDFVDIEMIPFEKIAKTAGFHTMGEVKRNPETGALVEYNITLLSIAMREGERKYEKTNNIRVDDSVLMGQRSLLKRLTMLVSATTAELQNAYDDLNDLNEKMTFMAEHDSLTGLYNRGKIEGLINDTIKSMAESPKEVSLIMLDIDYFKQVNDTYGHAVGDKTLRQLAAIMQEFVSTVKGAQVGRWGGEEFFIMLPDVDRQQAAVFAETLREKIAQAPFPTGEQLTVSMGVITTDGSEDHQSVYVNVDNALYKAKNQGRNCVVEHP